MSFLDRFSTKLQVPAPGETLPGRDHELPGIPDTPRGARDARSARPSRRASAPPSSASAASGAPSASSGRRPGVYSTAVGYAGGSTPNPTYEETCSGRTGHTEAVLVAYDPSKVSYEELLRVFWEGHDPTQGMRQGNDVGTQYRSAAYWDGEDQHAQLLASRDAYQAALTAAGRGEITTEIAPAAAVLLRRGLPPAVPPQGAARLLRSRRHRRELPDRHRRGVRPAA